MAQVLGETISNTGYIILIFQILVSSILERFRAIPAFLFGLLMISGGFVVLGYAAVSAPASGSSEPSGIDDVQLNTMLCNARLPSVTLANVSSSVSFTQGP